MSELSDIELADQFYRTLSGNVAEWPQLRPLLGRLAASLTAAQQKIAEWQEHYKGAVAERVSYENRYLEMVAVLKGTQQKIAELERERDHLRDFKELVHGRLDALGIPKCEEYDCRIGVRFNFVSAEFADRDKARADLAAHMQTIRRMGEQSGVWRRHCETCPGFLSQEKSE